MVRWLDRRGAGFVRFAGMGCLLVLLAWGGAGVQAAGAGPEVLTSSSGITIRWDAPSPEVLLAEGSGGDWVWRRREGYPPVPVRVVLLGVPFGAELGLEIASDPELLELDGLRCVTAGEVSALDEADAVVGGAGWLPARPARIVSEGVVRSQRIVAVELAPFQLARGGGALRLHRGLQVRLRFAGEVQTWDAVVRDPFDPVFAALLANAEPARRWRKPTRAMLEPSGPGERKDSDEPRRWKIEVDQRGIVRVGPQEIDLAGVDPRLLRLRLGDRIEPMIVAGEEDGEFSGEDYLEFVGSPFRREDGSASQFTDTNVYWLELATARQQRMERISSSPGSAPLAQRFREMLHFEENHIPHWPEDKFFWLLMYAGGEHDFVLRTPGVAAGGGTAVIRVRLFGYTSYSEVAPDHRLRASLNGAQLAEVTWDGQEAYTLELEVPQAELLSGENTLTLAVVPQAGAPEDAVLLNWIEVDYWREYVAEEDRLFFLPPEEGPGEYSYVVDGFSSPDIDVFELSGPEQLRDVEIEPSAAGYQVRFTHHSSSSTEYVALTSAARISALSVSEPPPPHLTSESNGADLIIITHRDFIESLERLVSFHESKGRRVMVVDVEDIFNEFSHGIFEPSAIRSFLRYAYERFQPPASQAVLLVGDATWDYKGYLETGVKQNFVPSYGKDFYGDPGGGAAFGAEALRETRRGGEWRAAAFPDYEFLYGEAMVDNQFVCVAGSDNLPDMSIGRICAESPADVALMTDKILAQDALPRYSPWQRRITFINGGVGDDEQATFTNQSETLISSFIRPELTGVEVQRIYKTTDNYEWGEYEAEIAEAINRGAGLVHFAGHAGSWSWEAMFDFDDIGRLNNQGRLPQVNSMTCNTVRFANPEIDSFGEGFQLTSDPTRGSIVFWGGCNFGGLWSDYYLAYYYYQSYFEDHIFSVGECTSTAKIRTLLSYPSYAIIIEPYTLLGDPTTILRIPSKPAVALAGYWDSRVSAGQGGQLRFLAWAPGLDGTAIQSVEIYYGGQPTGAYLYDEGRSGDFAAGDTVFGLALDLGPGDVPPGAYLIELMAHDYLGNSSRIWPELQVP
jgi:hypothetical protein